jgi:hypothetical protein
MNASLRDWPQIKAAHDALGREEGAARRLSELTGQDQGTLQEEWRDALRPLLREDTATALDQMGVLDEEVRANMNREKHSFGSLDLEYEIRCAVSNADVRTIWLPDDLDYYGAVDAPKLLYFVRNAARTTGAAVTSRVGPSTVEIGLDDQLTTLSGEGRALRELAFAALCRWAASHGRGRRFVLDEHWHAWLVDDAQLAALRRYRPSRLRAFDEVRTEEARRWLQRNRIALPPVQDLPDGSLGEIVIAWIFEAGCGVPVESTNPAVLWRSLEALGVKLPPKPRSDYLTTGELVAHINAGMVRAKSPLRFVGLRRGNEELVLFVPFDRLAALTAADVVAWGGQHAVATARSTPDVFRPPVVTAVRPNTIVPDERCWISDGESVDDPADYHRVVEELCALASVAPSHVSCTENSGVRKLSLRHGRKTFSARLRGRTDWIDAPPLIACLNQLVRTTRNNKRFYEFRDPRWGQEVGVVFATTAEARRLREFGFLVEN